MKFVLQLLALALPAAVCAAPAEGLRNPFWPQGYKGVTSPISAEPRPKPVVVPKPAANSAHAELAKATAAKEAAEAAARAAAAREAAAREAAAKEAAAREAAAKKAAEEKAAAEKAAQEAAAKAEAERNREITSEDWKLARKALKIRNPAWFQKDGATRVSLDINGKIYVDGDIVVAERGGVRYAWRIRVVDGKKRRVTLDHVEARPKAP